MKKTGSTAATWFSMLGLALIATAGCESVGLRSMRIYMQQRNWEKALDQGRLAVSENPGDAEAWFALAQVAAQVDSLDLMLRAWDRTAALTRKHEQDIRQIREVKYNSVFNRAVEHYNAGDLPKAEDRLDLAIRIDSTRANAHRVKGMIYQRNGQYPQAIDAYSKALNADTTDAELGREYALLLASTGQMEHGLVVMRRLYLANPGSKPLALGYAQLLAEAGRHDDALSVVESALAREPKDADLNTRAGILYMERARTAGDSLATARQLQAAVPYLEAAWAADSGNADVAYDLAVCLRQLGRLGDAAKPLEHILRVRPEDNGSRLQLAMTYLQDDKPDVAQPHLEEVINRIGEPTTAEDRITLSKAYRFLGIIFTVRGNEIGSRARSLAEEAEGIRDRSRRTEKEAKLQQANEMREESRRLFDRGEEMNRLSHEYSQ